MTKQNSTIVKDDKKTKSETDLLQSLLLMTKKRFKLWICQNFCDGLSYHLDNIFIRFGTKLHRQIVGMSMGTYCALVADLLMFCYEKKLYDISF